MLLDSVNSPEDLRGLTTEELEQLAAEIREFIVQAVSQVGGHLGSNLGVVELTLALHRVFDSPRDIIVWDTGHQAYVHKLVTGRRDQFADLRQADGLSGYPARSESPHDWMENSHASTSLSWAFGLTTALEKVEPGSGRRVIAVIGDGSLTGGMAFEALNNLGHRSNRAIIVLNDNGRSYAPTVGNLTENIAMLRSDPMYVRGRKLIGDALDRIPLGETVKRGMSGAAAAARDMFEPPAFFEDLGVRYTGPFDGHDIAAIEQALTNAASYDGPIVVHVVTSKGKGYAPAEQDTEKHLHDTGLFDPATGLAKPKSAPDFTRAFTEVLISEGEKHPELVALTAAMPGSTGLIPFEERWPERCIDVGIAEQHAVASAAGMAMAGLRPVVAIYSTFLTRAIDQMLFDVALHEQPVVFCADRAGITGPDGPSAQGIFDLTLALRVPGMTVFTPSSYQELQQQFREALTIAKGPTLLRWPKGAAPEIDPAEVGSGRQARKLREGEDCCVIAFGPLVFEALEAADQLARDGISTTVWDARVARPLDPAMIADASRHRAVVTVEDGVAEGGAGTGVLTALNEPEHGRIPLVSVLGVPVRFVSQGDAGRIRSDLGLDAAGIAATATKLLESHDHD